MRRTTAMSCDSLSTEGFGGFLPPHTEGQTTQTRSFAVPLLPEMGQGRAIVFLIVALAHSLKLTLFQL